MNENELEAIRQWMEARDYEPSDAGSDALVMVFMKALIKEVDDLRALVRKERAEFNEQRVGQQRVDGEAEARLHRLLEENRSLRVLLDSATPKDCFADVVNGDEDWSTKEHTNRYRDAALKHLMGVCEDGAKMAENPPHPREWATEYAGEPKRELWEVKAPFMGGMGTQTIMYPFVLCDTEGVLACFDENHNQVAGYVQGEWLTFRKVA